MASGNLLSLRHTVALCWFDILHCFCRSPPPVPARPASYTPSVAESMNTLNNYGMDAARNYGSAGDDLQVCHDICVHCESELVFYH